jgi:hypothetical protein
MRRVRMGCKLIPVTWRKYFSQLLNVYGVNDFKQTKIHKTEPVVPEPSDLDVEMAIGKLKKKQKYSSNPSRNDQSRE